MDVWRITVAVLRRWYVFLPLLALTVYGALRVGEGVAPEYEVTATAILVPGPEPSLIENPYGSLDQTSQVLAIVLDDSATREEFTARGLDAEYDIEPRSRSRIMDVTVLTPTAELSLATAEAVLDRVSAELLDRQESAGIREDSRISLQVLQAPSVSDVVTEGKLRNMVVVGIVGAALSLLVAVLFDDMVGLVRRWLRRKPERTRGPEVAPPADDSPREEQDSTASDHPVVDGVRRQDASSPARKPVDEVAPLEEAVGQTDLARASREP